jgi:LysM repeat protein
MYSFVTSTKIWLVLSTVAIMLLNGCASNPPSDNPQTETAVYHYVNPGDTLDTIARTYGRDPLEIAQWNNLKSPYKLETHQKLLVSGPPNGIGTTTEITPIPDYGPVKSRPIKKTTPKTKNNDNKKKATPKPAPKSAPKTNVSGKSYHQVQRGETLYSIAKRYGQDYRDVAIWNNLTPRYDLAVGRRLVVSGASHQAKPGTATTPTKSASKQKYVVQRGDTLYSIAKRFGYGMSDIMAWNGLPTQELPLGKTLIVSPPAASSFKPMETTHNNKEYHTVAAGETVYSLSRRYGYSVDQIAQWNNLPASHSLSVGQRIRVSPPTGSPKVSQAKQQVSQAKTAATKCHLVKSGETLYSISKQYGYDVAMMARWNNIPQPYTVRVGRNLRVSSTNGGNVCH